MQPGIFMGRRFFVYSLSGLAIVGLAAAGMNGGLLSQPIKGFTCPSASQYANLKSTVADSLCTKLQNKYATDSASKTWLTVVQGVFAKKVSEKKASSLLVSADMFAYMAAGTQTALDLKNKPVDEEGDAMKEIDAVGNTSDVSITTGTGPLTPIGGEKDAHGCLVAAGQSWCAVSQKCIQSWNEPCSSGTSGSNNSNSSPTKPTSSSEKEDGICGYPWSTDLIGGPQRGTIGCMHGTMTPTEKNGNLTSWFCKGINGGTDVVCSYDPTVSILTPSYHWDYLHGECGPDGKIIPTCIPYAPSTDGSGKIKEYPAIDPKYCGEPPRSIYKCQSTKNKEECGDPKGCSYKWELSEWSSCSQQCGGGTQTRIATCRRNDGAAVSTGAGHEDSLPCGTMPRELSRSCNTQACSKSSWSYGVWSFCDKKCGGTQTRTATCVDPRYGRVLTPDNAYSADYSTYCQGEPETSRSCNQPGFDIDCTQSYTWEAGEWSTCEGGMQTRQVYCKGGITGSQHHDSNCTGAKPAASQKCTTTTTVKEVDHKVDRSWYNEQ